MCTKNKPFADHLPTPMCLRNLWKTPITTALSCLLHRWQTWKHFSVLFQCFPCWKTRFFFALPFCFWMLFLELQAYRSMYICIWFWLWICLMVSIPECRLNEVVILPPQYTNRIQIGLFLYLTHMQFLTVAHMVV